MSQVERFSLLISMLGRIEAFLFPCIGKHLGTELGTVGGIELDIAGETSVLGGEV